ncbi:TPA: hypothetical protein NH735_000547 [Pseudomonas aeruginosa]|uniref:hypothetical protein n=1 Tax=Pseudomonas aeruginosa TaxID=287 RepID=UPI00053D5318|nr:hypothetical protein [Pseudomonas aeruginosa]EIU2640768.1 hypothetical protein [Pseudomonas aeruginosa]EIU4981780.1 hypothetical protein [Pseudomonas aeruginosa]EIU9542618.1 hypothetical protein [Pseudomonas aeruginosa]EIU9549863.1 hypothetical protein [Pseudomonas aeruginosa]EIY2515843.1 hypothetical protein [Pseudomonas aeruginosa]
MKVEELPQEGFAECPRYITLMRFAFLTGLSDRPDLLYAWIESGDLPMRTFGTQRLVDMQKLQKRIEEAKKCRCQVFRANHAGLETVYGTVG